MKKAITFLALFAAGLLAAETITFTKTEQFKPTRGISAKEDGTFSFKGRVVTYSSKVFTFDPAKKYTVSGDFRQVAGKTPAVLFFGLSPLDKNGREILTPNTQIFPGSDSVLTADVAKGAKVIRVKNAAKWRRGYRFAINTDPSLKDLPNFNIIYSEMVSAVKDGSDWKVTLNRPIAIPLKKGINIRQHGLGGAMYPAAPAVRLNKDWKTYKGTATGIFKTHGYSYKKFPTGTVKVRLLIFANLGQNDAVTEVKNLTLTIK